MNVDQRKNYINKIEMKNFYCRKGMVNKCASQNIIGVTLE